MCLCLIQVPVTVDNVSALHKSGGYREITVSVMTETVTNMMASSAQVIKHIKINVKQKLPKTGYTLFKTILLESTATTEAPHTV